MRLAAQAKLGYYPIAPEAVTELQVEQAKLRGHKTKGGCGMKRARAPADKQLSCEDARRFVLAVTKAYAELERYIDSDTTRRFRDRVRMLLEEFHLTEE